MKFLSDWYETVSVWYSFFPGNFVPSYFRYQNAGVSSFDCRRTLTLFPLLLCTMISLSFSSSNPLLKRGARFMTISIKIILIFLLFQMLKLHFSYFRLEILWKRSSKKSGVFISKFSLKLPKDLWKSQSSSRALSLEVKGRFLKYISFPKKFSVLLSTVEFFTNKAFSSELLFFLRLLVFFW